MWWSWLLTAVGVTGLFVAGRKKAWGWAIGVAAQFLWIAYATVTHQWGFYVSALAYGWVYAKNFLSWRKDGGALPVRRDGGVVSAAPPSAGSNEQARP